MVIMQQVVPIQTSGARTSDWIGQVKDGIIYAYDISTLVSESTGIIDFTKEDFEHALKKVSQKSSMPVGEHIREAI